MRVSVIGGDVGESIVVRTPGGHVGVIDAFAASLTDASTNPTLTHPDVASAGELQFVVATHPHADHYSGMRTLLHEVRARSVWLPPVCGPRFDAALARLAMQEAAAGGLEGAAVRVRALKEWIDLVVGAYEGQRSKRLELGILHSGATVYEEPEHDFEVRCLAPTAQAQVEYAALLRPEGDGARANRNRISAVLLVRYGGWKAVLGGDAEIPTWRELLESREASKVAAAQFLKVPHHGSPNASYEPLLDHVCGRGAVAAVTGFKRHGLPHIEGVLPLWRREVRVFATVALGNDGERHLLEHHRSVARSGCITCDVRASGDWSVTASGCARPCKPRPPD